MHDFLAVSEPAGQGVLVVEAWIPTRSLAEAITLFNSHPYRQLVAVGGPIQNITSGLPSTFPELAANRLEKLGFDPRKIVEVRVPGEPEGFHTLSSARAVKRWLSLPGNSVCCVDVFTTGTHARKSWVFFRSILGGKFRVGIIAGTDAGSSRGRPWFRSKHGIWMFSRNLAGYVYAELWALSHTVAARLG